MRKLITHLNVATTHVGFNLKNFIIALFVLFAFTASTFAQTPQYYNLNNGTSANSFPFNMAAGKATNYLFLAGDFVNPTPLPTGQMITKVYFRTASTASPSFTNLQILLAQDVITTLTSGVFYPGPYDTVFVKDTTLSGTTGGWMGVQLRHPFPYDPAKSLIIFVGQCGYTGTGVTIYNTLTTGIRRVWSVGGCPFAPYASGDASTLNFGVDVVPAPTAPIAPVLFYPANNAIGTEITPTFVWYKPATATGYWWQLVTDTTSMANLQNDSTLTDSTKAVSGLTTLTDYYWRVKGKNNVGWGSFSGWFKFTTQGVFYYNSNVGANANSFPFNQPAGKMVQWLALSGEINQPSSAPYGYITNFAVRIATGYPLASTTYQSFKIILGQTNITSLTSGTFYTGTMDTVYSRASVTFGASADTWLQFTLDHPTLYNPALSLVIQIEQCGAPGVTGYSLGHVNLTGNRRIWSVGGCPFAAYASAGVNVLEFGVNISPVSGVVPITSQIPTQYRLEQNYPNPFNPVTKINFEIPKTGFVSLKVYNVLGREVANLVNTVKNAGNYSVDFDGTNLSSGVYFYKLESNGFVDTKKMMLIK